MTAPLPQELLRRKRDGRELDPGEVAWLVRGIADGTVSDAQVGAFAMAVVLRGMTAAERVALTTAMRDSGEVLRWPGDRPVLDKHSTGGVGDKVSLLLAPVIAACGGAVPMISGRGLGHTGGTLDKLEAIPGYDTAPEPERLRAVVAGAGCAIVGQTAQLAPADRRLYAIRDATGTVESIPLLVGSILSKKLAAGLDGLVMDVKVGSGAFLPDAHDARELAGAIVEVAAGAGLRTTALLTDMDRVLGRTAGNAVEVREAIDHLTGAARDERLVDVTLELARELLALGGLDADPAEALAGGAAAERFAAMVTALGGPEDLLEAPDRHLARAPVTLAVDPERTGVVTRVDVRAVGLAVVALGGGRRREDDRIDPAVGLTEVAAPGERVGPGERPLALVHAADDAAAQAAGAALRTAFATGEQAPPSPPPVLERIAR
ncbi:MAG TPA: thymidine phosphorylase [Solirubrobacteraceae bacterium]|nr:thymidine phosphorylase [Solirubrobacteraceae bacterium]